MNCRQVEDAFSMFPSSTKPRNAILGSMTCSFTPIVIINTQAEGFLRCHAVHTFFRIRFDGYRNPFIISAQFCLVVLTSPTFPTPPGVLVAGSQGQWGSGGNAPSRWASALGGPGGRAIGPAEPGLARQSSMSQGGLGRRDPGAGWGLAGIRGLEVGRAAFGRIRAVGQRRRFPGIAGWKKDENWTPVQLFRAAMGHIKFSWRVEGSTPGGGPHRLVQCGELTEGRAGP